jgi:hypothetical protein
MQRAAKRIFVIGAKLSPRQPRQDNPGAADTMLRRLQRSGGGEIAVPVRADSNANIYDLQVVIYGCGGLMFMD